MFQNVFSLVDFLKCVPDKTFQKNNELDEIFDILHNRCMEYRKDHEQVQKDQLAFKKNVKVILKNKV